MSEDKLTKQQQAFVDAYLGDPELNGAECVRKAGYKTKYPDKVAYQLLGNPRVKAAIDEAMEKRSIRTKITQDMVLERWWAIANADPNELIYHRRVCCRYCFGRDHEYQWADEAEYESAVKVAEMIAKEKEQEAVIPSDWGGFGFDPTIRPHPKCPKCHGEGHGDIQAGDTRDLSPEGKLLYAGVKTTKEGFEIKMRDQDKALENVARHLGMFKDKLEVSGQQVVVIKGEEQLAD